MADNQDIFEQPILVTGALGFIGRNLTAHLRNAGYKNLLFYDMDSPPDLLDTYTKNTTFVFHLAGVNRPENSADFFKGNANLTEKLTQFLQKWDNKAPVLITSSIQAASDNEYGQSKLAAEQILTAHALQNRSTVFLYRLPGVFGKWSRPNYNSVVATFCYNMARGLSIDVRDPNYILPLCYIDDVVNEFLCALKGERQPSFDQFLGIEPTFSVSLGQIAASLQDFSDSRSTLAVPFSRDPFSQKLYSTYLSFLPTDSFAYPLKMQIDQRGSFTEFLRNDGCGQMSVNLIKPGVTKGNHWHHSKNEKFLVVAGQAVIRFRQYGENSVTEYTLNGNALQAVDIPTGYIHSIENTGSSDLVTLIWANEPFDPQHPDTYFERV